MRLKKYIFTSNLNSHIPLSIRIFPISNGDVRSQTCVWERCRYAASLKEDLFITTSDDNSPVSQMMLMLHLIGSLFDIDSNDSKAIKLKS